MVVINEVAEMFWGVTLEEGKTYTQTVESSFHISMAAIEPKAGSKDITSVYIRQNNQEYLLCSLQQGSLFQQTLDLGFLAGESLTFFTNGKGTVHMTGYRVLDDDMMGGEMSDEDDDLSDALSEDEDVPPPSKKQRKLSLPQGKRGSMAAAAFDEVDSDESDESEDEDESGVGMGGVNGLLDFEAAESDDEDDDDFEGEEGDDDSEEDDSDEDMSDSEIQAVAAEVKRKMMEEEKKKKSKDTPNGKDASNTPNKQKQQEAKGAQQKGKTPQQQGKTSQQQGKTPQQQGKTPQQQGKTPQQKGKTPQQQGKTPQQKQGKTPQEMKKEPVKTPQLKQETKTPLKRKLPSGVVVEDLKEGHGPEAKSNKMVHVYYTGKLTSGKIFDSSTSGRPFKFRLGKNEVIKGWEIGLQGMKVGGKRRLTIPPNLAYGSDRSSGLPPNSTLLFDIELKATS